MRQTTLFLAVVACHRVDKTTRLGGRAYDSFLKNCIIVVPMFQPVRSKIPASATSETSSGIQMMKIRIMWISALIMAVMSSAHAGYNVDTHTVPGWPKVAGKIAIVPAVCPANFDCVWLNETITDDLEDHENISFISQEQVSQAMLEAGVEQITDANLSKMAGILGAQSFLFVTVGDSDTKQSGAVAAPIARGGFILVPSRVAQGGLDVRIVSAEGKVFAKGTGFGESSFRHGKGVVGKIFEKILDALFPD
jgi:hypothetical protein